MLAILLGLGSSLSWGVADFCGGLASRRSRVAAVVLLSQATGLAILVVALVLHGTGPPPAGDLALGAAAGASGAAGLAAFYRALAVGTMSLVAPVAVLAVGGAVLAGRARGPASTRGLGLAVVAAAGFGGFFVLLAPAADQDALWAVVAARCASVPLVLLAALALGQRPTPRRADLPLIVTAGVLDATANVAFALGTQRGLLSVVAVLGSLYPVATVMLARAVLGERLGAGQTAGVAAALAGVALIALGAG